MDDETHRLTSRQVLALCARLDRARQRQRLPVDVRADLRSARLYLQWFASVIIAGEAQTETDAERRSALVVKALLLRGGFKQ
jgi:hypothetical protein